MIFLPLSALMSLLFLMAFRYFTKFRIKTLNAIIVNYFVCICTGLIFAVPGFDYGQVLQSKEWILPGVLIGVVFLPAFYLMGKTAQVFGIMVSSVASKISLVLPVVSSLFFLEIRSRSFMPTGFLGILLAILSLILCSFQPVTKNETTHIKPAMYLLPAVLFLLSGYIDSGINYANYKLLNPGIRPLFPVILFSTAAVTGIIVLVVKREIPTLRDLAGGVVLGIPNYFSLYFLLMALSSLNNDGAMVYPMLNLIVIILSAITGYWMFREKITAIKLTGIVMAVCALIIISFPELSGLFSW